LGADELSGGSVTASQTAEYHSPPARTAIGHVRWIICAVLFGAIVLIYIHRNVVSVLNGDTFGRVYGWNAVTFGNIGMAFTAGYAIGLVGAGRFLDWIGVRRGFLIAAVVWTVLAIGHGWVHFLPATSALTGFLGARFLLGIFEGAFFPASIRAVAEWFPKKERAFATGIFNAGSALGALLSPLIVPYIAAAWGWPMAFYLAGGLGVIWMASWIIFYREPEKDARLSAAELQYIRSDQEPRVESLPWRRVIGYKQTWVFSLGKFMTDPIWWFYIFWLPPFLNSHFKLDLKHFGPPLVIVYLMADGGSVAGGWLSGKLLSRDWSVNAGRKTAMLICALCILPVLSVTYIGNVWLAVVLIGLAAAAHQGWSANLFTLASDLTPKAAVSSVVGLGGMWGAIGGVIFQKFTGQVVEKTHTYFIPFAIAGLAYVSVLLVIHLMLPHLEPMKLEQAESLPSTA
jgi:ACS family hexuronate transporter-like MFS transporter